MLDLLLQALVGVGILGAGLWLGYRRWIRPRASALGPQGNGLLALIVLTLMGGLIGSPFWWFDEARSFAWDLRSQIARRKYGIIPCIPGFGRQTETRATTCSAARTRFYQSSVMLQGAAVARYLLLAL